MLRFNTIEEARRHLSLLDPNTPHYTRKSLSTLLNVSVMTLYRKVKNGSLISETEILNGLPHVTFKRAEVVKYIYKFGLKGKTKRG